MEGLIRAGGVMEGLIRAGGVMEGLIRAGGVMEGLIHGTISRIQLWAPHPQCSHQPADISDPTKMHKHNTKAVILTAQCHLISVLFRRQKRFFFSNAAIIFPCRSCSTTKAVQQMHRNQESEKCCNSSV
ncbi:hypothetical protein PO909_002084 [Leuciscus waleckii]